MKTTEALSFFSVKNVFYVTAPGDLPGAGELSGVWVI
jgi:hypothetical protein